MFGRRVLLARVGASSVRNSVGRACRVSLTMSYYYHRHCPSSTCCDGRAALTSVGVLVVVRYNHVPRSHCLEGHDGREATELGRKEKKAEDNLLRRLNRFL
jgi:hypothetical protein